VRAVPSQFDEVFPSRPEAAPSTVEPVTVTRVVTTGSAGATDVEILVRK
jgi:hypothetical protein